MTKSLLTALLSSLDSDTLGGISQQLGSNEGSTSQAVAAAVPLLLSALANNTSSGEGARSLAEALSRDHDGSILANLGGYVRSGSLQDGQAILGHVLGERRTSIERSLSEKTGLDTAAIGKLLALIAPVVLGMLGREQRSQRLDPTGLSALLSAETSQTAPDLVGLIGGLLSGGDS